MKIIGNHNGSWLVDDSVDENSDKYYCELENSDVEVIGDAESDCIVTVDTPEGKMSAKFQEGALVGKWEYIISD